RKRGEEPHLERAGAVAGERRQEEDDRGAAREVEERGFERRDRRRIRHARREDGVPLPLDPPEPEEREEEGPEDAARGDLPGIAEEDTAELLAVEHPGEERVREPEPPPGRDGDERGRDDRAAERARVHRLDVGCPERLPRSRHRPPLAVLPERASALPAKN